jgi:hypothetical protein
VPERLGHLGDLVLVEHPYAEVGVHVGGGDPDQLGRREPVSTMACMNSRNRRSRMAARISASSLAVRTRVRCITRSALSDRSGFGESMPCWSARLKARLTVMTAWRRPPVQLEWVSSHRVTWNGFSSATGS